MKYEEFRNTITGKGTKAGIKNFFIVPRTLGSIGYSSNQPKLEEYPLAASLELSFNKKGKKVLKFEDGFPDPTNLKFFFDREEAEAHAVFLMAKHRAGLIRALESFDQKTNYKGRFQVSFDKFPEVFI